MTPSCKTTKRKKPKKQRWLRKSIITENLKKRAKKLKKK